MKKLLTKELKNKNKKINKVMNSNTLLKDKNGKAIIEQQFFTFMFLKELNNPVKLTGTFCWNQDELRYEIDIHDNPEYTCLSYVNNGIMYDFELI
jgi:hypothetical protein